MGRDKMPRVVKFHADWCGPCHTLTKVMDGLGYEVVDVETDEGREVMFEAGVSALPTLVFYNDDGEEVKRIVGLASRRTLVEAYESVKA